MEKFPDDVRTAEEKTDGNPDIIQNEEFQPESRPNIANIFGDQTPKVKGRGRGKIYTICLYGARSLICLFVCFVFFGYS